MTIVASHGISDEMLKGGREGRVGEGAGGRAISEAKLVVIKGYGSDSSSIEHWASYGVKSAMGTPVRENGKVVGSLVVARDAADRAYTGAEREILVAFAKHASIALGDARTVNDAVHQALHDPLTGFPTGPCCSTGSGRRWHGPRAPVARWRSCSAIWISSRP